MCKYFQNIANISCNYLIVIAYFLLLFIPNLSKSQESDENSLVIAYLERFTRFIENHSFTQFDDKNKDFNLYYYGNNTFGKRFEEIFATQKIKNRKVNIRFVNKIEELQDANMIFISKSAEKDLDKIVEYANRNGILTTSYSTGFAKRGVHINLYMQDMKLKFEINHNSAKKAGFHISHLLLSKARIIE
ncbi:MAG: YfiR family protein [Candidatus Kapabacteria bacterium]|nr:YfiR family protein [Candidatus Kapabacteria bacterium]